MQVYKIDRLVIVAGPSAVGKSSLLTEMSRNEHSDLCEELCRYPLASQVYCGPGELSDIENEPVDELVFHYDFFAQYNTQSGYMFLPELINNSQSVIVLTLAASSELLYQRLVSRRAYRRILLDQKASKFKRLFKQWKKRKLYHSVSGLTDLYEQWQIFLEKYPIRKHLFVDTSTPNISRAKVFNVNDVKTVLTQTKKVW